MPQLKVKDCQTEHKTKTQLYANYKKHIFLNQDTNKPTVKDGKRHTMLTLSKRKLEWTVLSVSDKEN